MNKEIILRSIFYLIIGILVTSTILNKIEIVNEWAVYYAVGFFLGSMVKDNFIDEIMNRNVLTKPKEEGK